MASMGCSCWVTILYPTTFVKASLILNLKTEVLAKYQKYPLPLDGGGLGWG